jgi:hypothetical protein
MYYEFFGTLGDGSKVRKIFNLKSQNEVNRKLNSSIVRKLKRWESAIQTVTWYAYNPIKVKIVKVYGKTISDTRTRQFTINTNKGDISCFLIDDLNKLSKIFKSKKAMIYFSRRGSIEGYTFIGYITNKNKKVYFPQVRYT